MLTKRIEKMVNSHQRVILAVIPAVIRICMVRIPCRTELSPASALKVTVDCSHPALQGELRPGERQRCTAVFLFRWTSMTIKVSTVTIISTYEMCKVTFNLLRWEIHFSSIEENHCGSLATLDKSTQVISFQADSCSVILQEDQLQEKSEAGNKLSYTHNVRIWLVI